MDCIEHIEALFARHGNALYEGARAEPVTALAHALQCAQLAEWADASTPLVAAALLHDIGHFMDTAGVPDSEDDAHELRAMGLLTQTFGLAVAGPVRLHVAAKRYLVTVSPSYAAQLSPASLHSLQLQGGPMTAVERELFDDQPYASQALALRRWDDLAKQPGQATPPLHYYLGLLEQLRLPQAKETRRQIGALGG